MPTRHKDGSPAPMAFCDGPCAVSRGDCRANGCARRRATPADMARLADAGFTPRDFHDATPAEVAAAIGTRHYCPICQRTVLTAGHPHLQVVSR